MPDKIDNYSKLRLIVENDAYLQTCLKDAAQLNLQNWWIVGGALRDTVWANILHRQHNLQINDVDLIYFDKDNTLKKADQKAENILTAISGIRWSVKNQARMHIFESRAPYESVEDAISYFPETISCIALKFTHSGNLIMINMYGLSDLFNFILRPTRNYLQYHTFRDFKERARRKGWIEKWPEMTFADRDTPS